GEKACVFLTFLLLVYLWLIIYLLVYKEGLYSFFCHGKMKEYINIFYLCQNWPQDLNPHKYYFVFYIKHSAQIHNLVGTLKVIREPLHHIVLLLNFWHAKYKNRFIFQIAQNVKVIPKI
ncbi:hypothetical protein ACJX0J_028612, partial [Zea mays]